MKSGTSRLRLLAVVGATLALGACVGDDETLTGSTEPINGIGTNNVSYFERYVSLGNSITAGFQSSGLVGTAQAQSYAVFLSQRAGMTFFGVPAVASPGCPVPFVAPLTPSPSTVVANCTITPTAAQSAVSRNVAVPGARMLDLLRVPSPATDVGRLNLLLVGPRSQVRAMKEAQPTFVSAWAGNNDALEATLGGNLGPRPTGGADSTLTPLAAFQTQLNMLVDSIKAAGPRGALLVGVVNAIDGAPLIQPGFYFFLARDANGLFQGKRVNDNCSPLTATGRSFVSFQILAQAGIPEIDCSGATAGGLFVLTMAEQGVVRARVNAYNAAIEAAATANGWVYVDPNAILRGFVNQRDPQGRAQRIRKCQGFFTSTPPATPAAVRAALVTTCPVPPTGATANFAAPNFFGSLFSFDGVHPSTEAHRILAGRFAAAINRAYGTRLPTNES